MCFPGTFIPKGALRYGGSPSNESPGRKKNAPRMINMRGAISLANSTTYQR